MIFEEFNIEVGDRVLLRIIDADFPAIVILTTNNLDYDYKIYYYLDDIILGWIPLVGIDIDDILINNAKKLGLDYTANRFWGHDDFTKIQCLIPVKQTNLSTECPCGIHRTRCDYHK